jgi:hypothetical protein
VTAGALLNRLFHHITSSHVSALLLHRYPCQGLTLSALLTCLPLFFLCCLQGLLRSLGSEAEALQKIHVRIQRQLQNLEVSQLLQTCCTPMHDGVASGSDVCR